MPDRQSNRSIQQKQLNQPLLAQIPREDFIQHKRIRKRKLLLASICYTAHSY